MDEDKAPQQVLEDFFNHLKEIEFYYVTWTGAVPKTLVINPEIIAKLSRIVGFYQRPELEAKIPAHSPVVRHFKLGFGVIELFEDYAEKYMHFE